MTRDQALRKIKKLLAMAGSSNANEAATAMRQAQALMREYQLSAHEAAGVQQKSYFGRGERVNIGASNLANVVAALYGAQLYTQAKWTGKAYRRAYVFVSDGAGTVEICGYAMTVLARQLQRDCKAHLSRAKKAKNGGARGDVFALGWVSGLRFALGLVSTDAVPVSSAVSAYMDGLGLVTGKTLKPRTGAIGYSDTHAGYEAGQKAQLNKGVRQSRAALEHGL